MATAAAPEPDRSATPGPGRSAPAIGPRQLRRTLGQFATGVTVVTAQLGEQRVAMTANAVSSVSLDPPLVLVCPDNRTRTLALIKEAGAFAINILSEEQEWIGRHCAARETAATDRLAIVPHRIGRSGAPILDGCLAYLDCRLWADYPGGDHTIVVGEVVDHKAASGGRPVLFYGGRFTSLVEAALTLLRTHHPPNPMAGDFWG